MLRGDAPLVPKGEYLPSCVCVGTRLGGGKGVHVDAVVEGVLEGVDVGHVRQQPQLDLRVVCRHERVPRRRREGRPQRLPEAHGRDVLRERRGGVESEPVKGVCVCVKEREREGKRELERERVRERERRSNLPVSLHV